MIRRLISTSSDFIVPLGLLDSVFSEEIRYGTAGSFEYTSTAMDKKFSLEQVLRSAFPVCVTYNLSRKSSHYLTAEHLLSAWESDESDVPELL